YRFYVESFPPPSSSNVVRTGDTLSQRRSGIDGFMERMSSHLSTATKLTGLLLAPPLKQTTLARVDLIPLEDDRALAVLVTDAGWVTARAVTLDPPLGTDEVRALGRELNRRFGGHTVQDVVDMETMPTDPLDALHTRALGVVGPRRLPYPEVISIVNETARHVTDALSRVRQDLYLPS